MGKWVRSDGVISLRPWSEADVDEMVACLNGDEEIARWLEQVPQPYTAAEARIFLSRTDETTFAVVDAEKGGVLGGIGLKWNDAHDVAEIGYWARLDARGRGVTTRALKLASSLAFEEGAARVQLRADVENVSSPRRRGSRRRACCARRTGTRASGDARAG